MNNIALLPCEKDDWKQIVQGLQAYNRAQVPEAVEVPYAFPQYKVTVDGAFAGGILGRREGYNLLYIEVLYVVEEHRNKKLGTMLLSRMHEYAEASGCSAIYLSTHDFQAKGFYEKHDYTVFGLLDDCPQGHVKYFMKRKLPR